MSGMVGEWKGIFEPELTESVKGKLSDALREFLNYKRDLIYLKSTVLKGFKRVHEK